MHIFVHDYVGHPFQVGLSRVLAGRGHVVTHAYFSGDQGPKGDLINRRDVIERLNFAGIEINGGYDKTSFVSRRFKDVEYGHNVASRIVADRPDIVISGNTPTEAQGPILNAAHRVGASFVYWVQDFYAIAVSLVLKKKLGLAGSLVGAYYCRLERNQFRRSEAIVVITDDFRQTAAARCGAPEKIFTIENWGPAADIRPRPKNNEWACAHGLNDAFVFLYSGTLALKHNPDLLVALARQWKDRPDVKVVVAAQGVGVEKLRTAKCAEGLDGLVLLPLLPFEQFPSLLASADVLVAVLEPDAGIFSVPSKVQSYLCAKRPVLLAAPRTNLASKVLMREHAGLVVPPDDEGAFLEAADELYRNAALRAELAEHGYNFAQRTYDIEAVTDRFVEVFEFARSRAVSGYLDSVASRCELPAR